jgi:hypothetical protein
MIHMDCGVLIWAQKLASLAINPGISESRIRQSNRSTVVFRLGWPKRSI